MNYKDASLFAMIYVYSGSDRVASVPSWRRATREEYIRTVRKIRAGRHYHKRMSQIDPKFRKNKKRQGRMRRLPTMTWETFVYMDYRRNKLKRVDEVVTLCSSN